MSGNTYVVLIGVNEYPKLGAGASLKGSCNDMRHWLRFARVSLGVPGEQVQLLTHPALEGEDVRLPKGHHRGASLAEANGAIDALIHWLQENPTGTGLIVYSGHGGHINPGDDPNATDFDGDRLALGLSDAEITDGTLRGALVVQQLDLRLAALGLNERVTLVIDACYGDLNVQRFDRELITAEPQPDATTGLRVLLSTAVGAASYEAYIAGQWQSAYSFALLTLLSQWGNAQVGGVHIVRASHRELTFRARELLNVLGYTDQAPAFAGAARALDAPFNNPSIFEVPVRPSWVPDGNRKIKELGGDADDLGVWTLKTGSTILATGLVNNSGAAVSFNGGGSTIQNGKAMWYLRSTGAPQSFSSLTMEWLAQTASGGSISWNVPSNLTYAETEDYAPSMTTITTAPAGTSFGNFSIIDGNSDPKSMWVSVEVTSNGAGSYKVNTLSFTATSSVTPYQVTPLPPPGSSSGSWTKNQSNIPFTVGVTYSSNTLG
ncbi:MAG: caspase family protein [Deltaproteobacteria bacterium]|nr:caspase family protein [Deltaproteobacteria bacterium]